MIIDLAASKKKTPINFDVAIIGAGAAGIFLALKLAQKKIKVALIEGGDLDYTDVSQELYSGSILDRDLPYGLLNSRMRYFGGSTNCWAGGLGFFDQIDFEVRSWMELSGWPIPYNTLNRHYLDALDFLDMDIPLDAFQHIKEKLPGFETTGLIYTDTLRFGQKYLEKIRTSPFISLFLNSNIKNFASLKAGGEVASINIITHELDEFTIHASKFVLAAGGIENARILLNSKENKLAIESKLVGKYFVDHPIFPIATLHSPNNSFLEHFDVRSFDDKFQGYNYLPFFRVPDHIQKELEISNAVISFHQQEAELSNTAKKAWQLQKKIKQGRLSEIGFDDLAAVLGNPIEAGRALATRLTGNSSKRFAIRIQMEQVNTQNSWIDLDTEKDRLGIKKTVLKWSFDQKDTDSVIKIISYAGSVLRKNKIGIIEIDNSFLSNPDYMPDDLRGGQHHSGSTRMGSSSSDGVVDPNLKVFGVSNLFVVGSSTFPTNGWVNPTLTILALTSRLCEYLEKELKN